MGIKQEMSKWKWMPSAIAALSALIAGVAVYVSINHYNATELQRKIENKAARRHLFLETLQLIADGDQQASVISVLYKDSKTLGTMQHSITLKQNMLLLQAEELLKKPEDIGEVTHSEYLILAIESNAQGLHAKTDIYATKAIISKSPDVKAYSTMLLADLKYKKGMADKARKQFREALEVYDAANELLAEDQAAGKVQVCVSWLEDEYSFGDQSLIEVKKILDEGRGYLKELRDGPLRKSGERAFAEYDKKIQEKEDVKTVPAE